MPPRGYRKGTSDTKVPRPHVVKSRISDSIYAGLHAESDDRSVTLSSLIDAVLTAHTMKQRVELPRRSGMTSAALRELNRIGNNLNQLVHQSHMMRLHLLEADAKNALKAVLEAVRRLI
jgi:hypothetical protein